MKLPKGVSKTRTLSIPIMGSADHNSGFQTAIGGLVVAWANNESLFLAMLQLLLPEGENSATIVWHSLRTSQARLALISSLSRAHITDGTLLKDVEKAIREFRGPTGVRNFYCHATYSYDEELKLALVTGVTLSQDGNPLRIVERRMDNSVVNEIGNTTLTLAAMNRGLWEIVSRLEGELGRQRTEAPRAFRVLQRPSIPHPKAESQEPS